MKKISLIILLIGIGYTSFSQRLWIETEIEKEIINNFELTLSPQLRYRVGLVLKEYFIETQLEYKIFKNFRLGAGYRLGNNINKDGRTESFGRFNLDAKANYKIGNLEPKIRLRFTNANDFGDEYEDPVNLLRYKGELEYYIKKIKVEPYVLYEIYHDLEKNHISKARVESGLLYKVFKRHRIGAYYRLNDYLSTDKRSINIIGVIYKWKIK